MVSSQTQHLDVGLACQASMSVFSRRRGWLSRYELQRGTRGFNHSQYFNRVRDVHSYSTRGSSTDFVPPRVKSNLGKESFLYIATSLYNMLPGNLKMVRSLGGFKQALKTMAQMPILVCFFYYCFVLMDLFNICI